MEIKYNDTDITDMTRVRRVEVTQYLYDHLDTMTISFDNKTELWTGWAPQIGDRIRVTEEYADSGNQYVMNIRPEGDAMILGCAAVKKVHAGHVHQWEKISFKQMLQHLADDNGLSVEYYGVEDQKYKAAIQSGENDYKFINELCKLEGCFYMIFDGIIKVISNEYLKSTPTSDFTLETGTARLYDCEYFTGCQVTDGKTTGKAGSDTGDVAYLKTEKRLESIGEANRFATNMLDYYNKGRKGGSAMADKLITQLMPGSKIKLTCEYWTDQPIVISRVRHDYLNEKTKIWFYLEA